MTKYDRVWHSTDDIVSQENADEPSIIGLVLSGIHGCWQPQSVFIFNPSDRGSHCWAKICTSAGDTSMKSSIIAEGGDTHFDFSVHDLFSFNYIHASSSIIIHHHPSLIAHIYVRDSIYFAPMSTNEKLDGKVDCFASFTCWVSNSVTPTSVPLRMEGLRIQTWGYN